MMSLPIILEEGGVLEVEPQTDSQVITIDPCTDEGISTATTDDKAE